MYKLTYALIGEGVKTYEEANLSEVCKHIFWRFARYSVVKKSIIVTKNGAKIENWYSGLSVNKSFYEYLA